MRRLPVLLPLFFSIILAFKAVKPAWAAPEIEANDQCIAPYQFIELQGRDTGLEGDGYGSSSAVLGMYERISPDGRLVLRSFSGKRLGDVAIVELPAPSPQADAASLIVRTYRSPLQNEAFPVQGSWRYLVNPDGSHYALADVLQKGTAAKALFKGGMTGFYAAAAEVGEKDGVVQIRSLSWPTGDGLYAQGQGALQARTISVDVGKNRVIADTGRQVLCRDRCREDGSLYALPMIAPDGQEFSAMPQNPVQGRPTMRIFGFGQSGHGCELQDTFTAASGKTIFGYAPAHAPERGADLAFEAGGQVWWYSRQFGDSWPLRPPLSLLGAGVGVGEWIPTAFPGLTRDGRVIYGATWQNCTARPCQRRVGYIVADPYQLPQLRDVLQRVRMKNLPPACITVADVLRERARFATERGLALPE
jgi:hypothetical protein